MRAGVAAGAQVESAQQSIDHARRRCLAVGAGDVHRRVGEVRIPEQIHQRCHAPGFPLDARLGPACEQLVLNSFEFERLLTHRSNHCGGGRWRGWQRIELAAQPLDLGARVTEPAADLVDNLRRRFRGERLVCQLRLGERNLVHRDVVGLCEPGALLADVDRARHVNRDPHRTATVPDHDGCRLMEAVTGQLQPRKRTDLVFKRREVTGREPVDDGRHPLRRPKALLRAESAHFRDNCLQLPDQPPPRTRRPLQR